MQAGMGDIVFTPLYEVLKDRGVTFHFFHQLQSMGFSSGTVEEVVISPQAEVNGYQPLVDVNGLKCWPNEPDWGQIANGQALHAQLGGSGSAFETEHDILVPGAGGALHLRRDSGHFDHVILAASVESVKRVWERSNGPRHARFKRMLDQSNTVATQAFQLWLEHPAKNMGWRGREQHPERLCGAV